MLNLRNYLLFILIFCLCYTPVFATDDFYSYCQSTGFAGCDLAYGYDRMDNWDDWNWGEPSLKSYSGCFEFLAISCDRSYGASRCSCWFKMESALSSKYYFTDYSDSSEDDIVQLRPGMGFVGKIYDIKINGVRVYAGGSYLAVMLANDCKDIIEVILPKESTNYRYFYTSGYPAVSYNGLISDSELEVGGYYTSSTGAQGYTHGIGYKSTTWGSDNFIKLVSNPYTMQPVTIVDKAFKTYTKLPERYGSYSLRHDYIFKLDLNQLTQNGNNREIYVASELRNLVNYIKIIGKLQSEWYSSKLLLEPTKPSLKYDNGLFNTVDSLVKYEPADKTVKSFFIIDLRGVYVENNQQNRDLIDKIYNVSRSKNIELFLVGGYDETLFAKLLQK